MTSYPRKLKVVIPARGGSKGVPRKNILNLKGQPLIAYPILAAKECKNVSTIYVSTDDEEIAKIAKDFGAEIIRRPPQYATDTSLDIEVMRHAVNYLNDTGNIVHLRATTPMVASAMIDRAIEYFEENPECTALRSAHECPETAFKFFRKDRLYWKGLFDGDFQGDYYNQPRQNLPKTYQPNGYVDIIKPNWFMKSDSLHGDKMLAFETPYMHEIDTFEDFKILEAVHDKDQA
jgi:CMP-N,N'-diacetyllegionaminic acid synthase